jgi:hypothetical protein
MSNADIVVAAAESQLGSPYVYGAWGALCTVALRKRYANLNPDQKAITFRRCPVLSGKQSNCDGCKYQGKLAFDCRGFTHWCLKQVGIDIFGGYVGRQWSESGNWDERGDVAAMPDLVCCLFVKKSNGNLSHTGLHIGGGKVIHCSGEVKYDTVTGGSCKWTNYAIPKGLYTEEEIRKAHKGGFMRIMKKGMRGEDVRELQQMLTVAGYDCGNADGIFGAKTESALKAFQGAHGLAADGICGLQTWTALKGEHEEPEEPETPKEPEDEAETICLDYRMIIDLLNQLEATTAQLDYYSRLLNRASDALRKAIGERQ